MKPSKDPLATYPEGDRESVRSIEYDCVVKGDLLFCRPGGDGCYIVDHLRQLSVS